MLFTSNLSLSVVSFPSWSCCLITWVCAFGLLHLHALQQDAASVHSDQSWGLSWRQGERQNSHSSSPNISSSLSWQKQLSWGSCFCTDLPYDHWWDAWAHFHVSGSPLRWQMSGNKVLACCCSSSESTRGAGSIARLRLVGKMQQQSEQWVLAEVSCRSLNRRSRWFLWLLLVDLAHNPFRPWFIEWGAGALMCLSLHGRQKNLRCALTL